MALPPYQKHSETSRAAAVAKLATAQSDEAAVWRWFLRRGEGTDVACQTDLGMSGDTQRPRRVRLVELGLLADSGKKEKTPAGRYAVVWHVAVDPQQEMF